MFQMRCSALRCSLDMPVSVLNTYGLIVALVIISKVQMSRGINEVVDSGLFEHRWVLQSGWWYSCINLVIPLLNRLSTSC